MSFTLTDHNLEITPLPVGSIEVMREMGPGEGNLDTEDMKRFIRDSSTAERRLFWDIWTEQIFNHRERPVHLFGSERREASGIEASVVHRGKHGHHDRPVLKRSSRFTKMGTHVGKAAALQYALNEDVTPAEASKEVPYDLWPYEIMRVRKFVEEHGGAWVNFTDARKHERVPIGCDYQLTGVLYVMYTLSNDSHMEPLYVGINRLESFEGGLNWGLKNMESDSVFGRWGYGSSQHLGELSRVIFEDSWPGEPKPKYERWADQLFLNRSRVLRKPVYIELVPWLSDDLLISEQNLIMMADSLFDNVLNVQHANTVDPQQTTL